MNDPAGSQWRKWDLHFHTPKSYDHGNLGLTPAQLVDRLIQAQISVVAVTDHHVIDVKFIKEMQNAAGNRLAVLPAIELTSNLGGSDGVHFIAIFPEDCDLDHVSNELMSKLELASKRKDGISVDKLYVEFPSAAPIIQKLNGLITVHGHKKYASIEGISNHLSFKQQVKTDLLRECADIIELSDRKFAAEYLIKVFPNISMPLPLIVASDDHCREPYPTNRCCWIKADPTFAGLRMALREPQGRFSLEDVPSAVERLQSNKTRFIKSISFEKMPSMPADEEWLQGEVPLNPGLVAIIGNKGTGKSALADALGLLGSCGTSNSFSFLTKTRFCDPKTGRGQHVRATLQWHDGAPCTRLLSEIVAADEPERVKYLPQTFVETVCNDLATPGGGEFERELKKVVFSKVPKADQLGKRTLDELVHYRTQEIRREAESLASGLVDLAERLANLEGRLNPTVRSSLEKQISQLEEQIKTHDSTRPAEVKPPAEDPATAAASKTALAALEQSKQERESILARIKDTEAVVATEQLRVARASKLLDKLKNLEAEFDRRKSDFADEAIALGLDPTAIAMLTVNRAPIVHIRDEAIGRRNAAQVLLDGKLPDGLRAKNLDLEEKIRSAQVQLNRPQQEYQAYLERLTSWQAESNRLQGSADDPTSLLGLRADIAALDSVPNEIQEVTGELERIAEQIHKLRVAEADVYTELYGPVQKFVDEHPLAKEQLNIEFRVELIEEGFTDDLLSYVNQQRVGSFSGVEEGRARAKALLAPIHWVNWEEVKLFVKQVIDNLHVDKREGSSQPVLLNNQIGKGHSAGELYAWLFSLAYVKPRYILKSDGKGIEQLSARERGTLLLVFYLLVDDSDFPLIIDQPEANLDNATIAKKLVGCIRDARQRRQVIIVTHNPNLAVVCDADQIIHSSLDIAAGHRISYTTGALENPAINRLTIDVLEGGRPPFDLRDDTYEVCGT